MGSGGLQSYLVMLIANILFEKLKRKYFILVNEVGYKFAPRSWYNLDIAIIDKSKIKELPESYITISPEVVIEIDTKADLRKFKNPQDYFHRKTQDLLDSGVKKLEIEKLKIKEGLFRSLAIIVLTIGAGLGAVIYKTKIEMINQYRTNIDIGVLIILGFLLVFISIISFFLWTNIRKKLKGLEDGYITITIFAFCRLNSFNYFWDNGISVYPRLFRGKKTLKIQDKKA